LLWTIVVLVATIVCLITVNWGSIKELGQLLTFGLSLASLILAFVTIFYGFVSNQSITESSQSISGSASRLAEAASKLDSQLTTLDTKVGVLPDQFERVSKETSDAFNRMREEVVTRLAEARQANVPVVAQPAKTGEISLVSTPTDSLGFARDALISHSSIAGVHILYACSLAHAKKQAFDLPKLCAAATLEPNYCQGFLVACSTFGFLDFTYENEILTVSTFDSKMASELSKASQTADEKLRAKIPDAEISKPAIDQYFDLPQPVPSAAPSPTTPA